MTDESLIAQCRNGNPKAQRKLYDRFATPMFRLCFRYLKSEVEAEDALLAGFEKVFRYLDRFEHRGPHSLENWVRRIMVNEALMALRRQTNFPELLESESEALLIAVPATSTLEAEELYNLVRQLPVGYRTVFNLYVLEGYSHAEIATLLGIQEGTSKSQLSKAKALLRQLLQKHGITHAL
ncbi:RNA polymerase sigma-70 factor, ECF subfamily [Catalinimonas alkaloidigena]|uniref:RNA polymerase sigma-70 factor, ECF subfamily n=1 Tax=Catalinimonas alkaloidigena TaxID=1075417 RepID=A0A1G9QEG2_9BACT|nr:sigma-70 family RNA polymerase sigma factor [Catalinimonas alkaloidigena]SDM08705.1 RNA polymerase sigma-70 factor, ECF subfamily [Catalinimonas alkaloidigena]